MNTRAKAFLPLEAILSKAGESWVVGGVASNFFKDLDGDAISPAAIQQAIPGFMANRGPDGIQGGPLRLHHGFWERFLKQAINGLSLPYDEQIRLITAIALPLGRVTEMSVDADGTTRWRGVLSQANPIARVIWDMLREGMIHLGVSVGGKIHAVRPGRDALGRPCNVITSVRLDELSITDNPANRLIESESPDNGAYIMALAKSLTLEKAVRKPSPGQLGLFEMPAAPSGGLRPKKSRSQGPKDGDTKPAKGKAGGMLVFGKGKWRRQDNANKPGGLRPKASQPARSARALAVLNDDAPAMGSPKQKSRPRADRNWQSPKPPAAMGGRGMAETSLRPKPKPSLPEPLTLGDDDIFERNRPVGEPPKHYLVDVADIKPSKPASAFDPQEIESLAQSILESGGLLKPVVLQENGPMDYSVLSGDLEYHAAARAKQINPRAAEMVSAFVVPPSHKEEAMDQLALRDQLSGASNHHQDARVRDPRYYLVDVADIKPSKPASAFDQREIESLAQSILATGQLLSPLVVQENGPMDYSVLSGDLEYYAAARARQLDPRAAEMVSAFVAKPNPEQTPVSTPAEGGADSAPVSGGPGKVLSDAESARARRRSQRHRGKGAELGNEVLKHFRGGVLMNENDEIPRSPSEGILKTIMYNGKETPALLWYSGRGEGRPNPAFTLRSDVDGALLNVSIKTRSDGSYQKLNVTTVKRDERDIKDRLGGKTNVNERAITRGFVPDDSDEWVWLFRAQYHTGKKNGKDKASLDRLMTAIQIMQTYPSYEWELSQANGSNVAVFPFNPLNTYAKTPHRMYLDGPKAGLIEPHSESDNKGDAPEFPKTINYLQQGGKNYLDQPTPEATPEPTIGEMLEDQKAGAEVIEPKSKPNKIETIHYRGHKLTPKDQSQIGMLLARLMDGVFGEEFPLKSSELSPSVKKWGLYSGLLKQSDDSSRKLIISPVRLADGSMDMTSRLPEQILWNEVVKPMMRDGRANSGILNHPDWAKIGLEPGEDIDRIQYALTLVHRAGYIDQTNLGGGYYEYKEMEPEPTIRETKLKPKDEAPESTPASREQNLKKTGTIMGNLNSFLAKALGGSPGRELTSGSWQDTTTGMGRGLGAPTSQRPQGSKQIQMDNSSSAHAGKGIGGKQPKAQRPYSSGGMPPTDVWGMTMTQLTRELAKCSRMDKEAWGSPETVGFLTDSAHAIAGITDSPHAELVNFVRFLQNLGQFAQALPHMDDYQAAGTVVAMNNDLTKALDEFVERLPSDLKGQPMRPPGSPGVVGLDIQFPTQYIVYS